MTPRFDLTTSTGTIEFAGFLLAAFAEADSLGEFPLVPDYDDFFAVTLGPDGELYEDDRDDTDLLVSADQKEFAAQMFALQHTAYLAARAALSNVFGDRWSLYEGQTDRQLFDRLSVEALDRLFEVHRAEVEDPVSLDTLRRAPSIAQFEFVRHLLDVPTLRRLFPGGPSTAFVSPR